MDCVAHKKDLDKIRKAIRRHAKTEDPQVQKIIDAVIAPVIAGALLGIYDSATDAGKEAGKYLRDVLD
jgi:sensor histidine kinase regulating citrate/malate metabolism